MPRPPIGEKAMTGAERQRRHRDIVTQKPMTKSEREDLQRLIKNREQAMKARALERSAELLAEFEQQMSSVYSWSQDEIWRQATEAAATAVDTARAAIAARCEELGIPSRFAPTVGFSWHGRGENALKSRVGELRKTATAKIAALEAAALSKIKILCLDAQSQILAHGLTTASAIEFFDQLPNVETLMPSLEMPSIEQLVQVRGVSGVDSHCAIFSRWTTAAATNNDAAPLSPYLSRC
jgi:hypothetical protein